MSAIPQTGAPVVVVVGGPVTSSVKLTGKFLDVVKVPLTLPFELNGIMTQDEYLNTIATPINKIMEQSKVPKLFRLALIFILVSIFPMMASSLLIGLRAYVAGILFFVLFIVFCALWVVFMVKVISEKKQTMKMVTDKTNEISAALAPRGFNVRVEEQHFEKYVAHFLKISYNPNMSSNVAPVVAPAATIPYVSESTPLMSGAVYPTAQ